MAQIGLKNIHVAKILEETKEETLYDTPRKIAHAITANVTPNVETAVLHGDDRAVESTDELADIDIEIGITDLSPEDYAYLLGKKVDANGGVVDSINDVAPELALLFEVPLSKNGKRMYVYYKGKFSLPSSEHTTKQGSVEYQTPTLSGKFLPREDGVWRYRLDAAPTNKAIIDAWFTEVQESPEAEAVTPGETTTP